MAQIVDKLSALAVSRLTKPGYHGDGGGLWLQVSKRSSKSWIFKFTRGPKTTEMGLGSANTVSLSEARVLARECRKLLLAGKDPLEARKAARLAESLERARAMTFDQCAAAFITAHRSGWRNAKHAAQWESTLKTYAGPIIGRLPVASVDTGLVLKVLMPIWHTKTETATRLRGRIEAILDWATVSKHRTGENPARWRGHLDHLLADPGRSKRTTHHPALPWQQIGEFLAALRKQEGVGARALELAILTAARSGEVRLATWAEIDFDQAIWTIPEHRMKARREHRVPLSRPAVNLLRAMPNTGDFIFTGARGGKPLSDMSLTAVLRRMGREDITVHGFRSTFRDWAAESTNFPREVAEHALAHSLPDKVEAAYRRGDLLEKRIAMMEAWSTYCGRVETAASVTPIRGKATA
jgi:integrase